MNLPFAFTCEEMLDKAGMKKVCGGYKEVDGTPIGETKGDPPPLT